jgi:hypothetical protein
MWDISSFKDEMKRSELCMKRIPQHDDIFHRVNVPRLHVLGTEGWKVSSDVDPYRVISFSFFRVDKKTK